MRRRGLLSTIAVLVALAGIQGSTKGSQQDSPSQAGDNSDWFDGDKVRLNIKSKATNTDVTYAAQVNEEGDARFEITGLDAGKRVSGVIIVIGRRAMCVTGLELQKGAEIDALDAGKLAVQTALGLLSRAFPEGSASVGKAAIIKLVDRLDPITMKTPSATGEFPTPWSLSGTAKVVAAGVVSFQLNFSYPVDPGANQKENLELSGTWQVSPAPLVLADDTQLRGWQIYSLGPITTHTSEGTLYDYGARRMADFARLGELRRALLSDPPAGNKSPSMRTPGA
jgi:hypothetical protein